MSVERRPDRTQGPRACARSNGPAAVGEASGHDRWSARRARAAARRLAWLAFAAGGLVASCSEPPPETGGFRHILLISLDTTRADRLGSYGSDVRTPRLDALAAEGVRFADVTAPAPTTLASHTSMMTGSYPKTHGVPRNNHVVHPDNRTLAESLAADGFHTAAVLGSFALDRRFGLDQGFDWYDQRFDIEADASGTDQNQRRADAVTDAVLAHVDELDGDAQRVFLFAHYFDPHLPYDPPPAARALYTPAPRPTESTTSIAEQMVFRQQERVLGRPIGYLNSLRAGLPVELLEGVSGEPILQEPLLAAFYAGEVSYMDAEIGRLLDGLAERGWLEHTLVVVTADHGETFWEHADFWNHGSWVHQTTVHVPLIVRFPDGRRAGTVVDEPVSTVDLVPTLSELLELELSPLNDGVSLLPAIDGAPFERGPVFAEATQPYGAEADTSWKNERKPRAIREGRWKYVRAPYLAAEGRLRGYEQLFDLRSDPGERRNLLSGRHGPDVEALRARLAAKLDAFDAERRTLPVTLNKTLMEETSARLEALGYVGDR